MIRGSPGRLSPPPGSIFSLPGCWGFPSVRESPGFYTVPKLGTERSAMKRKKKFFRSVIADVCFVLGLVAVVVGVAAAGYGPLAITIAGAELAVVGVLLFPAKGEEDADDPG